MGFICDFCSDQRSMVYCRSDAACLCLSCDRNVHSANALSKRHSRTLLCERCNSQPAIVRCVEEEISLCQDCDWTGHGISTSSSTHKRQNINCYSGCPSASELLSIWPFALDSSVTGSTCEREMSLMSFNENSEGNRFVSDTVDSTEPNSNSHNLDRPSGSSNDMLPKLCGDYGMCEDFSMDELDMNLENYDELFGLALSHSEELLENGGISSLFGLKRTSDADLDCKDAVPAEGSSIAAQPACSNAASADSMKSAKTEPILCFAAKHANSGLSFSGVTGDGTAGDYQDCGASPMLLMGEPPPWCPPCPESSYTSVNRTDAVLRYKEKKKARKFEKTVRYASRKARADVRKRVKGRFVKAGDTYDYDPLSQTRSC